MTGSGVDAVGIVTGPVAYGGKSRSRAARTSATRAGERRCPRRAISVTAAASLSRVSPNSSVRGMSRPVNATMARTSPGASPISASSPCVMCSRSARRSISGVASTSPRQTRPPAIVTSCHALASTSTTPPGPTSTRSTLPRTEPGPATVGEQRVAERFEFDQRAGETLLAPGGGFEAAGHLAGDARTSGVLIRKFSLPRGLPRGRIPRCHNPPGSASPEAVGTAMPLCGAAPAPVSTSRAGRRYRVFGGYPAREFRLFARLCPLGDPRRHKVGQTAPPAGRQYCWRVG